MLPVHASESCCKQCQADSSYEREELCWKCCLWLFAEAEVAAEALVVEEEVSGVAMKTTTADSEVAMGSVVEDSVAAVDLADHHHHRVVAVVDLEGAFSVLPAVYSFHLAVYVAYHFSSEF